MKIAVRMDDITPDMDWERFLSFKEILDTYGIKPLIGVVPDNRDENLHRTKEADDFWEYIKELQDKGWQIALHGYQHTYTTSKGGLFPLNNFSEFAGIPFEEQRDMLRKGTEVFARYGIKTDIFMAPAHSYDKNTLKALRELGYEKMTDGFGSHPYRWQGMVFYPISFLFSRSLKKKNGYTTMVVHANGVDEAGMEHYRELFEEYQSCFISYDAYLKEKIKARGFFGHTVEYFMAKIKHYLVKLKA